MPTKPERAAALRHDWEHNPRWQGIRRDYSADDVVNLQGTLTSSTPSPGAAPNASGGT
ncbi:MAG: hypothetical protein KM312_06600 [Hydrogenibacillus schlegelii]|uniref:Isocitrate lyase n=1 Tax=Hydrogenibacillus schlegelii TaxID=1484 RepID=A0A947CX87_HYDSH|nr:hypothetical protein [Hydrogenibacillus schlegelii]